MKRTLKDPFYGQIFRLALPVVLQNLLSAAVSSADVVMLNSVSQSAISAVSLASQYTSIFFMILYGLGTGVTMLSAQYWGKKDIHAIELIQGIALRFSVGIAVVWAGCTLTIPRQMMTLFTNDAELIELGVSYLRIVGFSYLFWAFSEVYLSTLRSIERVSASTALSALALILNVGLNAVFIFGLFGAPKLGVAGVALATSISRFIQLVCCFVVSHVSHNVKIRLSYIFKRNRVLFRDFVRLSLLALANDLAWSLAFSMYSAILGHLDSDIVAANSIVSVVRNFATVFCYGFATVSTIWVGRQIGEGDMTGAKRDASRLTWLSIFAGIFGGILVLAVSPFVIKYATLSERAVYYIKYMLLINSYYVVGTALNTTLIAGVFRAGGDSRFGFICDAVDMWVYAIPLGLISAFLLKLPPLAVYFLLCTDEFVKWPWVIRHYRSYKWLHNITKEYEQS